MIRYRTILFVIGLILFFCTLPASTTLRLDRSLENMFAKDDPVRVDFETLQRTFGVSELVVLAYRDPELWKTDGSGLVRVEAIRKQIEALQGVDSAMDLSKLNQLLSQWKSATSLFGMGTKETNHFPLLDNSDPLATRMKKLFEGQTHSGTSDLVAIAIVLKKAGAGVPPISQTLRDLRQLKLASNQPVLLAGQRVLVEEGFDEIENDGHRLGVVSAVSLAVLLLLGFRSLRWAILCIALIQWSLVVSRGLMVALNWEITMVSSMMASLVTVISVATVMHWLLGFQKELKMGHEPEKALQLSWSELKTPIAWACVTDAIAFASLGISKVGPIQDYGMMMALSSLVVLSGIGLLVPSLALMPWLGETWERRLALQVHIPHSENRKGLDLFHRDFLSERLVEWLNFTWPRAVPIVIVSVVIGLISAWGATRTKVETNFIENFREGAPIVKAYSTIERELGGAGVWDIILPIPDSVSEADLDTIRTLESQLRDLTVETRGEKVAGITSLLSAVDADDIWKQNKLLGRLGFDLRFNAVRALLGSFSSSLVSIDSASQPPQRKLRVMLRSREQLEAEEKQTLIAEVRRKSEQAYSESKSKPIVAGYYVLLTSLVSSVVADQWICLGMALVGVWVAMAIALKQPLLSAVALIPNLLPSLLIMSWFGFTGTPVNLGAAMIAAVSLGISVDSSLHYLTRYQREVGAGRSTKQALQSAQSEIGLAVVLATIALVVGFGSLAFSDFLPTVVFGTTAALSMLGGLIGNLVLLPALVTLVANDSSQKAEHATTRSRVQISSSQSR